MRHKTLLAFAVFGIALVCGFVRLSTCPQATRLQLANAPYSAIIPFLSEHVAASDQLLFVGASTDMPLQLLRAGYGGARDNQGFMTIIDAPGPNLDELRREVAADPELAAKTSAGKLKIIEVDLTNMPDVCKQSVFDAIIDYGALDSLLVSKGKDAFLQCVDHLHNAVRLGNILVCLSQQEKEKFCTPFEERFGWVQELDGDPGEISAWYRGKTNIAATKSDFAKHGLKMYVYTNSDNC